VCLRQLVVAIYHSNAWARPFVLPPAGTLHIFELFTFKETYKNVYRSTARWLVRSRNDSSFLTRGCASADYGFDRRAIKTLSLYKARFSAFRLVQSFLASLIRPLTHSKLGFPGTFARSTSSGYGLRMMLRLLVKIHLRFLDFSFIKRRVGLDSICGWFADKTDGTGIGVCGSAPFL
jgi:hypothetical protein